LEDKEQLEDYLILVLNKAIAKLQSKWSWTWCCCKNGYAYDSRNG
jgi:hypothetical protein